MRIYWIALLFLLPTGCRWSPSNQIEIQVHSPGAPTRNARGNPTDPLDLQCFFATVLGDDIKPALPTTVGNLTSTCLEIGTFSGLVDKDALMSDGIKMTVTAGAGRRVRLMGIQGINQSCGTADLATLLAGTTTLQMFALGETHTDLFKDTEVTIENGYKPASATELISFCSTGAAVTPTSITGIGQLHRIYAGSSNSTGGAPIFSSGDVDPTLPMKSTAGAVGNMISLPVDGTTVGSNANLILFHENVDGAGAAGHARVDLIFTATIAANLFLKVDVTGKAGSSYYNNVTCGLAFTSLGTLSMAIWDQFSGNWDSIASGTAPSVQGPVTFIAPKSGDGLSGDFYHVSIRSNDVSFYDSPNFEGTCSALQLFSIHTSEYDPAFMSSNPNHDR